MSGTKITLPTLFAKDSKGKIRVWKVHTEGNEVVVTHGALGGKMQSKRTVCKPKNVGKKNETTGEEQALSEARSKWNKQKDREDYHEDVEKSGKQLRPMLALDYHKAGHRVDWADGWVSQPKLDGVRLVSGPRFHGEGEFEMLTRKGETYHTKHLKGLLEDFLNHIKENFSSDVWALDGELYKPGLPLQTITSYARKYQEGKTELLEYHLFDLVFKRKISFEERHKILTDALDDFSDSDSPLKLVPYYRCKNYQEFEGHHELNLRDGYEGTMLRLLSANYDVAHRSANLMKFKNHETEEYKVIGFKEDKNGCIVFKCQFGDEDSFECTPKRTHEERKQMLEDGNDFIDKWLTVKYYDKTIDGKPKFPVGLAFRECDEDGNPLV